MSDYESGSPPSRGEMDATSLGYYSALSVKSGNCVHRRMNGATVDKSHSPDYEYQIREMDYARRGSRRSLGSAFDFPDLRSTINTRFASAKLDRGTRNYENGFDFGDKYRQIFAEHKRLREELEKKEGDCWFGGCEVTDSPTSVGSSRVALEISPIWCMDYLENLIVVGCANGTLEFWEGTTGKFKVTFL